MSYRTTERGGGVLTLRVVQGERFVTATDGEIPKRQVPPQMKGEGVLPFPERDRGFHERERADVIVGVLVDVSQRMSRPHVEWIGSERPFAEVSASSKRPTSFTRTSACPR